MEMFIIVLGFLPHPIRQMELLDIEEVKQARDSRRASPLSCLGCSFKQSLEIPIFLFRHSFPLPIFLFKQSRAFREGHT